jgi:hypothetical protein
VSDSESLTASSWHLGRPTSLDLARTALRGSRSQSAQQTASGHAKEALG